MSSSTEAHKNPNLKFLLEGKFTDFEIRARGYHFKVHRVVIAGSSDYFATICGGQCKEATGGFVDLDEEPSLVAMLIIGLYQGSYYSTEEVRSAVAIMNDARTDVVTESSSDYCVENIDDNFEKLAKIYSTMFYMAEYYRAPAIQNYTVFRFSTMIRSPNFTLKALICVIDIIYNHKTTISDTLRRTVCYWAHNVEDQIVQLGEFEKVFQSTSTFAWDFATSQIQSSLLYCSLCTTMVPLPNEDCACGLRGLCGLQKCHSEASTRACTACGKRGGLSRVTKMTAEQQQTIEKKVFAQVAKVDNIDNPHAITIGGGSRKRKRLR